MGGGCVCAVAAEGGGSERWEMRETCLLLPPILTLAPTD